MVAMSLDLLYPGDMGGAFHRFVIFILSVHLKPSMDASEWFCVSDGWIVGY